MPSILDAVRAAIQSCFSRHLLAFLLVIVYDSSDMPTTLPACSNRQEARDALVDQCEPVRLVEALRNNGCDVEWVVSQLKKIAEEGGTATQLSSLKMFIGMFVGAGMDYDIGKRSTKLVGPPAGTAEIIDQAIGIGSSPEPVMKHSEFEMETTDDGSNDEGSQKENGRQGSKG